MQPLCNKFEHQTAEWVTTNGLCFLYPEPDSHLQAGLAGGDGVFVAAELCLVGLCCTLLVSSIGLTSCELSSFQRKKKKRERKYSLH